MKTGKNRNEYRRRKKVAWQLVEIFEDKSELVRHTGSFAVCAGMQQDFTAAGFKTDIRPAPKE